MRSQGRSHEKRELPAQLRTHTARCTDGYSAASCQKDAEKDSFARTCTAKERKRETMETTGRRLASMCAAAGSERSTPLCEQPAYDLNPTSRENGTNSREVGPNAGPIPPLEPELSCYPPSSDSDSSGGSSGEPRAASRCRRPAKKAGPTRRSAPHAPARPAGPPPARRRRRPPGNGHGLPKRGARSRAG